MPVSLNANALVSLARTKAELDISSTDFDDQISQYINIVSDHIELECNRIFREQTYTHQITGNGTKYLPLKQFPVTALTSVKVDSDWTFAASSALNTSTQVGLSDEVFLVRKGRCHNVWPKDESLSIQVVYTAGYSTIPDGIQGAAIEYVRLLYLSQGDRRLGRGSKSKLGDSASFSDAIPSIITTLIEPYKRGNVMSRAYQLIGWTLKVGDDDSKADK